MKRIFFLLISIAIPAALFAGDPAWVHIEKGKQYLRQHELGNALKYFRSARDTGMLNADADFYIGLVYEAEQNLNIAERYYLQALAEVRSLYNPSDIYLLHYQLAELYWLKEDYLRYEQQLRTIIEKDTDRIANNPDWTLSTARSVLLRGGIDRLGILFRLSMSPSFYASRELGAYLVANGRDSAIDALLIAYIQGLSIFIENIKIHEPDFQYSSFEQVLRVNDQYDHDAQIRQTVKLFEIMYYLGLSIIHYDPSSQTGTKLLTRVANSKSAGRWAVQAASYIASNKLPLLDELVPMFPAAY